jgi:hypothetical protein
LVIYLFRELSDRQSIEFLELLQAHQNSYQVEIFRLIKSNIEKEEFIKEILLKKVEKGRVSTFLNIISTF